MVLLNVGSITKGRQEAWRLHNRAWRLQNRGWRLQNRGLETPKSRPGGSKIDPRALQDTIFERHQLKITLGRGAPSGLRVILSQLGSNLDAQEVPNRGPSMKKSMLKNKLFLASIFEGFGPRFGKVFGRFFGCKMHANSDRLICVKS